MLLIVALLSLQATYEERARAVDASIVVERLRIATAFETSKAWGWARGEYRKVLRLAPESDVARKLNGSDALPHVNETDVVAKQYHDLTGQVAKVATAKHAELARWCSENGRSKEAAAHWRWTLLYTPTHVDAVAALGLLGSGVAAREAIWKETPWTRPVEKADAGEPLSKKSPLETAWKVKTIKRKSGALEWEALDLGEEPLKRVVRQANAVVDFMRAALDDGGLIPRERRHVLLPKARYLRYIDELKVPEGDRALFRRTEGFYNPAQRERVQLLVEDESGLDRLVVASTARSMLDAFTRDDPPWWFAAGTANACEILFHPPKPKGRAPGAIDEKDWTNSGEWDPWLRMAVLMAKDPSMDELTTGAPWTAVRNSKGDSMVRFLMIRYPSLFRSLAASFREKSATTRAGMEKALGFTLEELDEFWRRWIATQ